MKRNHGFLECLLAKETYTHLEQCLHRPFKPWRFPRTTFRNAVSMSLFLLPHCISTPHLPVPYIFGTKLPVANISGNWATGSKYTGNWKMRVHTRFTQDQSVDRCETCFLRLWLVSMIMKQLGCRETPVF